MKFDVQELNKLDEELVKELKTVRKSQETDEEEAFHTVLESFYNKLLTSYTYTDEIVFVSVSYLLQEAKNSLTEITRNEAPSFSRLVGIYKDDLDPLFKIVIKEEREKIMAEIKKREEEKNIVKDEKGSTIIEYAILAPILFLLLLGILEFNLVMYSESVLQGAITTAARAGKTGYVNTTATGNCPSPVVNNVVVSQTQSQYINCIVQQNVGGLLNPNNVEISYIDNSNYSAVTYASNCTNNPNLVTNLTPLCSETAQNAGDIVVYTATYQWPIITPFIQNFLGKNGYFTLKASAVVKNEPYGAN